MEGNQSLAKIGVFLLLGVNVGAYYYFWPRNQDAAKTTANAATPEKGATKLLPTSGTVEEQEAPPTPFPLSIPGQPKLPPPPVVLQTEPLVPAKVVDAQPVSTPRTVERRAAPDDDKAIRDLLNKIDRELPKPMDEPLRQSVELKLVPKIEIDLPAAPKEVGIAPPKTDEKSPFQQHYGGPVGSDGSLGPLALPRQDVAVASPLAPKAPPARWLYNIDKVGERKQLTARLRDTASERFLVEFRILCDRVEATQTGMKAAGNISFVGAGWKGTCQSLTLTAHEPRLVFEDRVEILQDILGTFQESVVRGDRITWDLPAPTAAPTTPANTGVTQPLVPIRPGLDSPK